MHDVKRDEQMRQRINEGPEDSTPVHEGVVMRDDFRIPPLELATTPLPKCCVPSCPNWVWNRPCRGPDGVVEAREPMADKCWAHARGKDSGDRSVSNIVSRADKQARARCALLAVASRDVKETADALTKLTDRFQRSDFQQLEDHIPPEVWDGLMQALASYLRQEAAER